MARILVVDDHPLDAVAAVQLLRQHPTWVVEQCSSGADALAALKSGDWDLVLTDLHMPEIDGLALMQKIHRYSSILPVVVMTSRGDEWKAVQALEAGAASYLPKSRLDTDLVSTCSRVLDTARLRRDQAELLDYLVAERFEISIENERQHIPALVEFIVGRCLQFGACDQGRAPRIGVAIEEAVINAMVHGNLEISSEVRESSYGEYEQMILDRLADPSFRERKVRVIVRLERNECRITVRDEGSGFSPRDLPDPRCPENLARSCGRGILLMRAFLDEVTFNKHGNEVLLVVRGSDELLPNPLEGLGVFPAASVAR